MKNENQLSAANKAYLELVKIGIGTSDGGFDFSSLSDEDWNNVFDESRIQSTELLCLDAARDIKEFIPTQIYSRWFKLSAAVMAKNFKILESQNRLVGLLEGHGIPYIILKGFSSAYYYPDYEKRSFGDVDFLINVKDWEKAKKLFIDEGYSMELDGRSYHTTFRKDRDYFEMHKQIAGVPGGEYGEPIRRYLVGAVERYEMVSTPSFRKPTDTLHGVVILLHTLHHLLSKGAGIRHLCDWACFVERTHAQGFWQDELLQIFESFGLSRFLFALTYTVVKYLGVQRPDWLRETPETLSDELYEMFMHSGNFGRKNKNRNNLAIMFSKREEKLTLPKKVLNMIKALNDSNEQVYPILKKVRLLYPFIMLWRVIKYIFLVIKGKRPSLIEASRFADKKNEIYMKYELYKKDGE